MASSSTNAMRNLLSISSALGRAKMGQGVPPAVRLTVTTICLRTPKEYHIIIPATTLIKNDTLFFGGVLKQFVDYAEVGAMASLLCPEPNS